MNILQDYKSGLRSYARPIYNKTSKNLLSLTNDNSGIRILDEEWDTLVILDCARFDIFNNVSNLPGSLRKVRSRASATGEFIRQNFEERKAHDLVYLSANPTVGKLANLIDIYKIVGVWGPPGTKRGQESKRGLVDPGPVLQQSRDLHNKFPNKRHIVHLLPPHVPHRFKHGRELPHESPYRNYDAAREGLITASDMKSVYSENLGMIINEISSLLNQIDGKIVVTADHGELLGEGMPLWMKLIHHRWGNRLARYDFGHYPTVDVPELRDVPWLEYPYKNRRTIVEEVPQESEFDDISIRDNLSALGYVN